MKRAARAISIFLLLAIALCAVSCSGGGQGLQPPGGEPGAGEGAAAPPDASAEAPAGTGAGTGAEPGPGDSSGLPEAETEADARTEEEDEGAEGAEGAEGTTDSEEAEPPRFGFIDTHADTITRALLRGQGLFSNDLHIDFTRLLEYDAPVQVFALWCADRYVADAFEYTNSLIDFFEGEVAKHSDIIEIALTREDLERNFRNGKISAVLSIEGGEALMGDLGNVDHFFDRGVRIMSLTWNRENELGFGQATGSKQGIKPFGAEVIKRMEELGMVLDVSHINEAGFWDIHRLSALPYMASHSNAYSVTPHDRNLKDDQIRAIADRGGAVGLALYPLLLSGKGTAGIGDVVAHAGHFIDLGAGGNIGLGGDLDGFGTMPDGLAGVSSYKALAAAFSDEFGEEATLRIMSGNTYSFLVRYWHDFNAPR